MLAQNARFPLPGTGRGKGLSAAHETDKYISETVWQLERQNGKRDMIGRALRQNGKTLKRQNCKRPKRTGQASEGKVSAR